MVKAISLRWRAVLLALFVTLLWSSSWVLIKIGLLDIPPLTFAGMRYSLAFLLLVPVIWRGKSRGVISRLSTQQWGELILLGLLFYAATQGAQFVSLLYLPAITSSLILSFTSVVVAILGIFILREAPSWVQWAGTILYLIGIGFYFYPLTLPAAETIGVVVALGGVLANAASSVLGRRINRREDLEPTLVTWISMGVGAFVLLIAGFTFEGLPPLNLRSICILIWLASVNSAVAFTLWNQSLRILTAIESSIINNTMLFQIAILAWIFLNEAMTAPQLIGMVLAGIGTIIIQVKRKP